MCGINGHMAADQGWFYKELGRRLQRARKKKGISQEAIGKAAGLTRSSIANIENGRQPVHVLALCRMVATIDIAMTELIPELRPVSPIHLPDNLRPIERQSVLKILAAAAAKSSDERASHGSSIQIRKEKSK